MKFLADEHIETSIIRCLRDAGIDILSIDELYKGLIDEEIINLTNREKRVIITRDSDFLRLHAKGVEHPGIIFVKSSLGIGEIINNIQNISIVFSPEDIKSSVIFLPLSL